MEDRKSTIFLGKQDTGSVAEYQQGNTELIDELQQWHDDITKLCRYLSSKDFNVEEGYNRSIDHWETHKRWLYADISNFVFTDNAESSLQSNVDGLRHYAYQQKENPELPDAQNNAIIIDKLWNHVSLAISQKAIVSQSRKDFKLDFETLMMPYTANFQQKIENHTQKMTEQLIALIAIFTALSFIAFGGITSLESVLSAVSNVPILELMIVGCIWGIFISNVLFVFIYFIAKLTNVSIKTSTYAGAKFCRRYPFFALSNYLLFSVLAIACWLYYIDYANAGTPLLNWSAKNSTLLCIVGSILLILAIIIIGWRLVKRINTPDIDSSDYTLTIVK